MDVVTEHACRGQRDAGSVRIDLPDHDAIDWRGSRRQSVAFDVSLVVARLTGRERHLETGACRVGVAPVEREIAA